MARRPTPEPTTVELADAMGKVVDIVFVEAPACAATPPVLHALDLIDRVAAANAERD